MFIQKDVKINLGDYFYLRDFEMIEEENGFFVGPHWFVVAYIDDGITFVDYKERKLTIYYKNEILGKLVKLNDDEIEFYQKQILDSAKDNYREKLAYSMS